MTCNFYRFLHYAIVYTVNLCINPDINWCKSPKHSKEQNNKGPLKLHSGFNFINFHLNNRTEQCSCTQFFITTFSVLQLIKSHPFRDLKECSAATFLRKFLHMPPYNAIIVRFSHMNIMQYWWSKILKWRHFRLATEKSPVLSTEMCFAFDASSLKHINLIKTVHWGI